MSVDLPANDRRSSTVPPPQKEDATSGDAEDEDVTDPEGDEEDEEEHKLKYAKLTGSLGNVYRNGDSTSSFTVVGDKMVMGTHNGNIHVLSLPTLQSLRTYHAHQATVTAVSVSPAVPILPTPAAHLAPEFSRSRSSRTLITTQSVKSDSNTAPSPRNLNTSQQQQVVQNTPRNQVYIATSSLDGHVCVSSLVDPNDVQLRNFSRPVNAVALSPDYKNDKTYLSGGLSGQLILTVGGKVGTTIDANTNSAAAAASGWLGSIGLGGDRGRDTILHSGEGGISTIRWSKSGKWVVWVNDEGIKIMRSHLKLGSEDSEHAWRRIAHAEKPNRKAWEGMAGVWKAKCEWIEEKTLESDRDFGEDRPEPANGVNGTQSGTSQSQSPKKKQKTERLMVGWGDMACLIVVNEGGTDATGNKVVGSAEVLYKLRFTDCLVSGLALYTPSQVAILAWRTRDDDDKPIPQQPVAGTTSTRKGRHHRHTGLAPQLRLVDVVTGEESEVDELPISRFEMLSAQDYHFATLYVPPLPTSSMRPTGDQKGAFEGLLEVAGGKYAARMFSSGASIVSRSGSGHEGDEFDTTGNTTSPKSSASGIAPMASLQQARKSAVSDAHPYASGPGLKLLVTSPYDCVLATKREPSDHLEWLLSRRQFSRAWKLIDEQPDIVDNSRFDEKSFPSRPGTPSQRNGDSLADFLADDSANWASDGSHTQETMAEREKRRIGDLWIQQLVSAGNWTEAGEVAGRVLGFSQRWEHWVLTFAHAKHFDEITPYIPFSQSPPLPSLVYEVVLGHYIAVDRSKLRELLELWDPELFDAGIIITAIKSRIESGEVTEESVEDGVRGKDWRILVEALAKLYLTDGRAKEALRCYVRAQNAEAALKLIKEENMVDSVIEDVPSLLMLRITREMMEKAPLSELVEASSEALQILVDEAHRGTVPPAIVIRQLLQKGDRFMVLLFFYLRALWYGSPKDNIKPRGKWDLSIEEGHALVEDHADLAVELFAEYDRELLMTFLRASSVYNYDKAIAICRKKNYTTELVYVLAKTGQTRDALFLIIDDLGDVKQAIEFVQENPDLWDDLLEYGMSKPRFIRGMLEDAGTAVDPIKLVRRIPEGVEIDGLREGVTKMMKDYDIQFSISAGVAGVLKGEVASGMDTLRAMRRKGVKFEVLYETEKEIDIAAVDAPTNTGSDSHLGMTTGSQNRTDPRIDNPGRCIGCGDVFHKDEKEALVGFACSHVYHLSCLLRANPDTANEDKIERLVRQLGYGRASTSPGDRDDDGYSGGSVGAKVAHAHIIKNVLRGGCQLCMTYD